MLPTLTFTSTFASSSAAAQAICARSWNLNDKITANDFFMLFMQAYNDYHTVVHPLRHSQAKCFDKLIQHDQYLPEQYILDDFENWKGLTGKYNNHIFYQNRNKDKTVVIFNNHLTWYEALHGGFAHNAADLHMLKFASKSVKDCNFISITEDLNRLNDNVMMYPSYFMEGISSTVNTNQQIIEEIKQLVPANEYVAYTSCKNTMMTSIIAGELGVSKLYVQHGSTSFVQNPKFTLPPTYAFDCSNDILLDNILENIQFTTFIRESHFDIQTRYPQINDLSDVLDYYPHMKIRYGYALNFTELNFMNCWVDYLRHHPHMNLTLAEFEHDNNESDLMNHWHNARNFFNENL